MDIDKQFAEIIHGEHERTYKEMMGGEESFTVGGHEVTMTEDEWHDLMVNVSERYHWAVNVLTWADLYLFLSEFVGFSDEHKDMTPEEFKRVFFTEGVARSKFWARSGEVVWPAESVFVHLLMDMGYFDSLEEMQQMLGYLLRLRGMGADGNDNND